MKIALFFDGNNFYRALDQFDSSLELNYDQLAEWVVEELGQGDGHLAGAYYFTGVADQPSLDRFLKGLEMRKGFFVRRAPIVDRVLNCPSCQNEIAIRTEKQVDTWLVAEMVQRAAMGTYDVAVLFSGDEDLVPAVDAVSMLGCQVYVASWEGRALSQVLRGRAYGHVDLVEGVSAFTTGRARAQTTLDSGDVIPAQDLLDQLAHACTYFSNRDGHVSRWYFENRWKPDGPCPPPGEDRQKVMTYLINKGDVEEFDVVVNGRQINAVRPAGGVAIAPIG